MAGSWLQIPDDVAEAIGEHARQLLDLDPRGPLTCQVCGQVKPAGQVQPMSVVARHVGQDQLMVGVAHRSCQPRGGGIISRFALSPDAPNGVDASAVFGERALARPAPVLCFESHLVAKSIELPAGAAPSEPVDVFVAGFLQAGFVLVSRPWVEVEPPMVSGWTIDVSAGRILLIDADGGYAYVQEQTSQTAAWTALARAHRVSLVVTGTGLGLGSRSVLPEDFVAARRAGTLVAGSVRVVG